MVRWAGALAPALLLGVTSCSSDGGDPVDPDPQTGSVRATVTDAGAPFANVTVQLFADGGGSPIASLATVASGQVTFANLEPGAYDIAVVIPAGFELASGDARRDVNVTAGQQASVTFALEEIVVPPTQAQVRARVLNVGSGVAGVPVMLFDSGGTTPLQALNTADDGRVLFALVDPGTYEVEFELPDGFDVADGETTRKKVTVTAGAITDVQFSVIEVQSGTIEVTVAGTSFASPDVTIEAGSTIRWVWQNGTHTVTPDGHSEWTTAQMNAGSQTFEHVFTSGGTFEYHCEFHAGMDGVIRVRD